ncbi:MAG: glycosyltransferase family 2 protein [Muribaculaceae bacterium]|nr:glycosyltransferase family 2 protein [Muribaculaceae bacterium]
MRKPAVSVIVPAYNTEATLSRCLDSILAQTFKDYEVVIVDDGSPDNAGVIADDYAERHERIHVIHKQNQGLAEARRTGVLASHGEFVMHVDSDDTILADAIDFLYHKMIDEQLDIAYGNYIRIPEQGRPYEVRHQHTGVMGGDEFLAQNLSVNNIFASWGCLTKRELWDYDVFPSQEAILPSEDIYINIKMSEFVNRIGIFNHPVYHYYYNSQSLSITGRLSGQNNWKRYFDEIERNLKRRGLLEKCEDNLYTLKIDRLAFYIHPLDKSQPWVVQVLSSRTSPLTVKHRILKFLLHSPSVCHAFVMANRWVKSRVLHIYR